MRTRRERALCCARVTRSLTRNHCVSTWFFLLGERRVSRARTSFVCCVHVRIHWRGNGGGAKAILPLQFFRVGGQHYYYLGAVWATHAAFLHFPRSSPTAAVIRPFKRRSPEVVAPRNRVFHNHNHTVCMPVCLYFERWNSIKRSKRVLRVNGFCSIFKNCTVLCEKRLISGTV